MLQIIRRSTLQPYYREHWRVWVPRGSYYIKTPEGELHRRKGFRGEACDTRALCQAQCERLNKESDDLALSGPIEPTFEEAVETYLTLGGDRRFLGEIAGGPRNRLLDFLGQKRVNEIDDEVMANAKKELYPNASVATVNRQLYTPVISVLRLAAKKKSWKPNLKRPKGYSKLNPAKSPGDDWFDLLKKEAPEPLWALLMFLTIHGRRPSDALRRLPAEFDPQAKTIMVDKDKNGDPVLVRLADPVVDAIKAYNWQAGPGLFGTLTWKARRNAYRMLRSACKRAAVPYFTMHKAARHRFAKRLLEAGHSLAHVKSAGRWKTFRPLAELHGHLEHSEVDEATKAVGVAWANGLGKTRDNVVKFGITLGTPEGQKYPAGSLHVRYRLRKRISRQNAQNL